MKKQFLILFFLAPIYSCELILKAKQKYKYAKPKECLFRADEDTIRKHFTFPASYAYDCDCKKYLGIDEIFRNTSCPFCKINNPEAQQRFKQDLRIKPLKDPCGSHKIRY